MLDSTDQCWLNLRNAVPPTGDLDENFIGLTHSESVFFAKISKDLLAPLELRTVDELERFVRLYERHELTRAIQRETNCLMSER